MTPRPHYGAVAAILAVAFLEGFTTLAAEIYAVRASATVVGASVTVTGILLGAVLVALSLGYYLGGRAAARLAPEALMPTAAARIAEAALLYALVLPAHETALVMALGATRDVALGTTIIGLAYVPPVALASQALPLMAQRRSLSGAAAGESAGLLLAVSTAGSVAGSALTPLVLFDTIGVRATAALLVLAAVAASLLALHGRSHAAALPTEGRRLSGRALALAALAAAGAAIQLATAAADRDRFDTAHQSLRLAELEEGGRRIRVLQAGIVRQTAVEVEGLAPAQAYARAFMALAPPEARRALVVGAAGFAVPEALAARGAEVVAVDVDPRVEEISERAFLRRPLSPGVTFLPLDARLAVRSLPGVFDLAFLDAFTGLHPPQHLFTVEALRELRSRARVVVANMIFDPALDSRYARRALATWRAVFPAGSLVRVPARPGARIANVLLCSAACEGGTALPRPDGRPYTDDLSGLDRDADILLAELLRRERPDRSR